MNGNESVAIFYITRAIIKEKKMYVSKCSMICKRERKRKRGRERAKGV